MLGLLKNLAFIAIIARYFNIYIQLLYYDWNKVSRQLYKES